MSHARERSDRAGGGCGPTVGTFSKIRVSKSHFKGHKTETIFSGIKRQISRKK